jgi:hypothetical protein
VTYLPVTNNVSKAALGVAFCLIALATAARAQVDTRRRQFPLDVIRSRCIDFKDLTRGSESWQMRDCQVSDFGQFGVVAGKTYYYATYCIIPNSTQAMCGDTTFSARYHHQRGLAIFARPSQRRTAELLFERVSSDIGIYRYDIKPEIIRNRFGTILYVPIVVDGTANFNESEYYLLDTRTWRQIDSEAWLADLAKRIPRGREMRKGVWPDLHTMRAEAMLYNSGDANCCPSAGSALARLSIRDKKFVIDSLWLANSSH